MQLSHKRPLHVKYNQVKYGVYGENMLTHSSNVLSYVYNSIESISRSDFPRIDSISAGNSLRRMICSGIRSVRAGFSSV